MSADDFALAYGGASPTDFHLLADVVRVDDGIYEVLAQRERSVTKKEQTTEAPSC
jgi:hypothetical protein